MLPKDNEPSFLNAELISHMEQYVRELEDTVRSSLLWIHHGFVLGRRGYTAAAFVDEDAIIWTAHHNVSNGRGIVITPDSYDRVEYTFPWRGDGTASSDQPYTGW